MTHRSRTGGPPKARTSGKPKIASGKQVASAPRKLHHPPVTDRAFTDQVAETPSTPTPAEILSLIRDSLATTVDTDNFIPTVQKIKALLYDKKWLEVFEDATLLEAYAGRWVPSRVMCFRDLLWRCAAIRERLFESQVDVDSDEADQQNGSSDNDEASDDDPSTPSDTPDTHEAGPSRPKRKVVSLGGGAGSEALAVAAIIKYLCDPATGANGDGKGKGKAADQCQYEWVGIDIGPWQLVLDRFEHSIQELWELSASAYQPRYIRANLLDSPDFVGDTLADCDLVTILFTLTELLSQSRQNTIALLHTLSAKLFRGALLLVVDSASDISEFELGSSGRKWPVFMVLDAILQGMKDESGAVRWERLEGEDSRWYRLPEGAGAGWPVKLENTRYWYRLYRRL